MVNGSVIEGETERGKGRRAQPADGPAPLTVLYDGTCPLCRREMGLYRNLQPLRPDQPVCYADISDPALALPPGTTRTQLLARFHVQRRDGQLLSGAAAFLALWAALPGWRWLAWLGCLPGAGWVMEGSYRLFLRGRPTLQRWVARLNLPGLKAPEPPRPVSKRHNVPDDTMS
jgi:predicted DCC family thiol-disulfide oxidoreductase YuxK